MQSIWIVTVQIVFVVYCASSIQSHEFQDAKDDSMPLPFQDQIENVFDAFTRGDISRMEESFTFLENIDPDEFNKLDDSNRTADYRRNRIDYVPNRIKSAGYPVEVHQIITDDGYILRVFRIPYGKKSPQTDQPRPPVLVMHGLMDSSNGFIVQSSEDSLAYILADAGYDVWLANARGTEPSRAHVRLNPNGLRQKKYWSFSWHQIGVYDNPAIIDHILNVTNQQKVSYIGHSQGTTAFLVMASMRPEYNQKLLDVHLLAPVSSLKNIRKPLYKTLARFYTPLKRLVGIFRIYKITLDGNILSLLSKIVKILCKHEENPTNMCELSIDAILGPCHINATVFPNILAYTPAGASIEDILHYGQMIRDKEFRLFDYGSERENQRVYGRSTPPLYNLTAITAPVNLYYSKGDDTATLVDAIDLQNKLPNMRSSYLVPVDDFSHVDFGFSYLAKQFVYEKLISNINEITGLI